MNKRKIGILGLMAMIGIFWGYSCVDAAITGISDNTSGLTQYLGEEINFQMATDGPATATVVLTTAEIKSVKEIIAGDRFFDINRLWWNQFDGGIVGGKVEVFVVNKSNGNGTWSTFEISDYETPKDLFLAINTIAFENSTHGSVTYWAATDKVVFKAAPEYEIGLREYCDEAYKVPLLTQLKLPIVSVNLTAYTPTRYGGIYEVPVTEAIGTWTVYGFAVDGIGTTSMKGSMTITMDGSQSIPVEKSKIIGLRVEPSPSKQFFNSLLKQMHVQMVVATLPNGELGEKDFNINSGDTNFTLVASTSTIKTGSRVIIWNDFIRDENNTVVFDHGHVWSTITTTSGTITFSDADLYFGSSTGTYSTTALRMKNFHVAIGTFTTKGEASFDLGIIQQDFSLYDDGQNIHSDAKQRDGIFSNTYMVPEGIDIRNVNIIGHFMDGRGYRIPNDGYPFNDTDFSNDIKVNICTIPPEVGILGANPSTFNPVEGKNCDIKYNLKKGTNVNVRVIINKTTSGDGEIVKDLGTKRAIMGDNVRSWDGKDKDGRLVPDGKYYYHIVATDEAGNKAGNIVNYGVIVVTYVRITVTELVVSVPQAVSGKGINRVTINAVASLDGTPEQLRKLNFDVANSSDVYNRPYALFDFAIYDKSMNEIEKIGYDLVDSTGVAFDSDPFPNGRPNYLITPSDEKNWLSGCGTSSGIEDIGDGEATNDWDTLVPFDKVDPNDANEQRYKSTFAVIVSYYVNSPFKEGTFFVKGFVSLDSANWKFKGYDADTGKEKWHCSPSGQHYGVQSKFIEQRFEVWEEESSDNTDKTPPIVYESYPSNGAVVSPFDIKSGGDGIWVKVKDNGVGVEFRESYIKLIDPDKEEVVGERTSNAIDMLRLIIDKGKYPNGLEKPGAYTIEIVVRDKNNNITKVTRSFTVSDKLGPDIESVFPQEGSVYYEGFGLTLSARISELERGKSGVNWKSSRIELLKDGTDKRDIQRYYKHKETDENQGVLTYELPQDFLKIGTYTMNVLAWDNIGNPSSKEVSFRVFRGVEIFFNHPELGTVSTLVFKPDTRIFFGNGSPTVVSTQTITLQRVTIDTDAFNKDTMSAYTLFGSPISVLIGTRSAFGATFSQSVQLIIRYTGTEINELPPTQSENDLVLYGYDGKKWEYLYMAPKGIYSITSGDRLYSTYTLAYITPQKWTVMSGSSKEWTDLKLDGKRWMELVGTITTNSGMPIPNGSITIGIIKDYPSPTTGYKILSPVVAFYFNGERSIKFNEPVPIWIYYTEPLPSDAKEGTLTVVGCDKNDNWTKITGVLDKTSNYISFNHNFTYKSYAIMYATSEVPPDQKKETIEQEVWCYPNPAKGGKVFFRYYVAENDVEVTVKIYTLLGDLLWNGSRKETAGIHDKDFVWNCQNLSGEPVASGVYIYRLMMKPPNGGSAITVTKKLIVIQ